MNNFSLSRVLALVTVGGIATLGAVSATFGAWSPTNISSSSIYCAGNGSAVNPTESYVYGYGYYAAGALGYECIPYNTSGGTGGGGGGSYTPTNSTPVSTTTTGTTITTTTVPTGISTGVTTTTTTVRPTRPTRPVVTRPVVRPTYSTQGMLQTGTPAAKKGITVSKNKKVDTARPTWFAPTTLAKASTDVSSWTRLLPKGDRNQNMYVVIPTVGMIAPIQSPSDAAIVAKFNAGTITTKEVSKYFLAGALHHPNSATPGMNGNMILGGHSSWFSRDKSAYRTVFQGIIEADAGEQVWVFMKNVDGGYNLYKYNIYASYNTTPGDMDALMQTEGAEITLYTCTPIGGVKGRWVVKAKLISE